MTQLTADQRADYDRDGFLVVDGFLDPGTVAAIQADIACLAARHTGLTMDDGGLNLEKVGDASLDKCAKTKRPGMLRKVQGAVFALQTVREVFCRGKLVAMMRELLKDAVHYHSSKVMFKPAGGGAAKPWHQDAAYWSQYSAEQITVWIAIQAADSGNGCIWAIPGSHRLGLIPHHGGELQVDESMIDIAGAVPVPVMPGGLLIFHSLVLHKSDRNTSTRDRWAIICDYDRNPNPCLDLPRETRPDDRGVWCL